MTQLTNGKFLVLFSYNMPVAVIDTTIKKVYKTDKFWSKTTSTHINKWFKMITNDHIFGLLAFVPTSVPQDVINGMARQ